MPSTLSDSCRNRLSKNAGRSSSVPSFTCRSISAARSSTRMRQPSCSPKNVTLLPDDRPEIDQGRVVARDDDHHLPASPGEVCSNHPDRHPAECQRVGDPARTHLYHRNDQRRTALTRDGVAEHQSGDRRDARDVRYARSKRGFGQARSRESSLSVVEGHAVRHAREAPDPGGRNTRSESPTSSGV